MEIQGVSPGQAMKIALLMGVVVVFIFLILKDAWKALRRRAHWIPGDFLVLSAFTIQLLNLVTAQSDPVDISSVGTPQPSNQPTSISSIEFWMTHTSRIMLCVVVANLMPGMAKPGSEGSWGKLMALALTIFLHVTSELYTVRRNAQDLSVYYSNLLFPNFRHPLDVIFPTLVSLCFVMLLLLLGCANIAGRGIERIVAQKIPLILKGRREAHHHHHHHHHVCWRTVEDWMVRVNMENEDHHQTCWRIVEEFVLRVKREKAEVEHLDSHCQDCWRIVEDAVLRVNMENEDHHQTYWRIVEDFVLRVEREKAEVEHLHSHCQDCWRIVEDAVLRAWIVARAYSLEYIIARSALASSAAVIVTFQIVITMVGGFKVYNHLYDFYFLFDWYDWLRFTATILQCIFILIGWFIITWRWATTVAYYRRWQSDTWRSGFRIEDFWTRHLRELQQTQEPRLPRAEMLDTKINRIVVNQQITSTVPRTLLYAVIGLQWLTVTFSKACWLPSLMLFHNKLVDMLLSLILSKHEEHAFQEYSKYKHILEGVQMLGETPQSLWLANRKSIAKAKKLIIQGNEDGEFLCERLVQFLATKRTRYGVGRRCLEPYKPQTELKYLCNKSPIQHPQEASDVENQQSEEEQNGLLAVEEHFTDVSTKSWKMTAVSLLTIIVHLSQIYAEFDSDSPAFPPKVVTDCLEAYSQAWEIIDFVEETDTEADGITSQAADRYFDFLQKKVKKWPLLASKFKDATPKSALDDLKNECKSKTEPPGSVNVLSALFRALGLKDQKGDQSNLWENLGGKDSLNWKAAASGNAVYKLCNSIQCDDGTDVKKLLEELESSLADIINECLEKIQYLLLLNSKKWARNSDEKRMGKALYTAGKAKLLMYMLDMEGKTIVEETNDSAIVPI